MTEFRVRRAEPGDRAFLVVANRALARETEATELDEAVVTRGVAHALDDEARGLYFIAESNPRDPAGSLLVTREWSDWRDSWIWWIQSVYVDPAQRRKGVYRCLHEAVLREARARADVSLIRLYVDRDNDPARTTYEAMGMHLGRYDLMEQAVGRDS
jgi:GNAT superfamily N-acetyltransferase